MAALRFGFIELDAALLHSSSAAVDDTLTPDSPSLLLLDRLTRLDVNRLFTACGGRQCRLMLTSGGVDSEVRDLEEQQQRFG